jgi:phage portal protein BeeE
MDSAELFRSVLHQREVDTTTAPRGTALQRAIVARLEKGEKLKPRAGGCFLLPDDLNWGAEVYRSQHLEQFLR